MQETRVSGWRSLEQEVATPPVFLRGKSHGQEAWRTMIPWGWKKVRHDLVTKNKQTNNTVYFNYLDCDMLLLRLIKWEKITSKISIQIRFELAAWGKWEGAYTLEDRKLISLNGVYSLTVEFGARHLVITSSVPYL